MKNVIFAILALGILIIPVYNTYNTAEKVVLTDTLTMNNIYAIPVEFIVDVHTGMNTIDTALYSRFDATGTFKYAQWITMREVMFQVRAFNLMDRDSVLYTAPKDTYGEALLALAIRKSNTVANTFDIPIDSINVKYQLKDLPDMMEQLFDGPLGGEFMWKPKNK